jgi:glycosyltransferase involved in cell wall biosynthesis
VKRGRDKTVIRRVPSSPGKRPHVTVVVPTYNYGHFLAECAGSVLTQRDVDVSLLVIDDCSSDDTPRVTAELAASDPRVSVIRNERNRGFIASINVGFERLESEYVVKLDADDLLTPGSLARATALLEAHPDVGFVYGRPHHFSGPVPPRTESRTRSWTIWSGRAWVAQRCRSGTNAISQPEVVMRTALLRRALPIRRELPHTSDLHLWMQLAAVADVGRINGPAQGCYRIHDASMQRTVHAGVLFDLRARRDAFDAAFAAEAGALAGAEALYDRVRRTLAANAVDRACRAYDRGRTEREPIDDYVAFAIDVWPHARELPEWRALNRRQSVGADRAPRHPRFFADSIVRRVLEEAALWRWQRTGELGPSITDLNRVLQRRRVRGAKASVTAIASRPISAGDDRR